MKLPRYLWSMLLLLLLISCGKDNSGGVFYNSPSPLDVVQDDGFVTIATATLDISQEKEQLVSSLFRKYGPISYAYAQTSVGNATASVTYTLSSGVTFTVTETLSSPSLVGDNLNLGSITITGLDTRDLRICGSGSQKCNLAVIRVYTSPVLVPAGFEDLSGLVNTSYLQDRESAPLMVNKPALNSNVGLGVANSTQVQTYTIPNNSNRLQLVSFPTPVYEFSANLENSGIGVYKARITIELALNRI